MAMPNPKLQNLAAKRAQVKGMGSKPMPYGAAQPSIAKNPGVERVIAQEKAYRETQKAPVNSPEFMKANAVYRQRFADEKAARAKVNKVNMLMRGNK